MVGSIKIYFDEEVLTSKQYPESDCHKHLGDYFDRTYHEPVQLEKGEQIGEFNMGSRVIMVFEAPKDGFEWSFGGEHEKVVLGTSLNKLESVEINENEVSLKLENSETSETS